MKQPATRILFWFLILLLSTSLAGCAIEELLPEMPSLPKATPTGSVPDIPIGGPPTDVPLEEGAVTRVVDGDTIDVLLNGETFRVRYILVNTPETKHPTKGQEPFGPEAFEANRALVEGKTVLLERDVSQTDKYGRLLRYVYVDNLLVNEQLLRLGLAHVDTYPPDVKYVERFRAVQRQAQLAGLGMWTDIGSEVEVVALDKIAEYADIKNVSSEAKTLDGWVLLSERGTQKCDLNGTLQPGETLRIWARAIDLDKGGFNCGRKNGIWSNDNPDPAVLLDSNGIEVSRLEQ